MLSISFTYEKTAGSLSGTMGTPLFRDGVLACLCAKCRKCSKKSFPQKNSGKHTEKVENSKRKGFHSVENEDVKRKLLTVSTILRWKTFLEGILKFCVLPT